MSDFSLEPDLCAREPIEVPGAIQPFGALVVVSPEDLRIVHRSVNAAAMLGLSLTAGEVLRLAPDVLAALLTWQRGEQSVSGRTVQIHSCQFPAGVFHVEAHCTSQGLHLAFEPVSQIATPEGGTPEGITPGGMMPGAATLGDQAIYAMLRRVIDSVAVVKDVAAVGQIVARHIRAMTGFNRTLIYRFDQEWNGRVIAEDGDGTLPSYLDLHFPASDIPAQARTLYERSRLRLIPNAEYVPVAIDPPVSPIDGEKLDLSMVSLRSVSPIHLQYMRNMDTLSSMSISLTTDGKLWGLISCHHKSARYVAPRVRSACDFLGQLISQQISDRERMAAIEQRIALKRFETELLVKLARAPSFQSGLAANPELWLSVPNAAGAAVILPEGISTAGITPAEPVLLELANWLQEEAKPPVYETNSLGAVWAQGKAVAGEASGLLSVAISQLYPSFIMWFRPEVVRTVTWAGDPRKATGPDTLSPRASFDRWKEQVRGQARPWLASEIETAADFRTAIIDFVLRRAEERAKLTEKLQVSNKELEAFSYSVSHDLRAPFRHIVGYTELLRDREKQLDPTSSRFLDTIRDAALSAGQLVDDLLAFSQLNRTTLSFGRVDMSKLVAEARNSVLHDAGARQIDWRIEILPDGWGDAAMLRQALLNLISNAVKYTGLRERALIEISGRRDENQSIYIIRDNGTGFDMRYVGKLFGVFQRLHRVEEFHGTGIGLALTKRVIDRHGGWIKAEGFVDQGAIFTFALPVGPPEAFGG
jgi:two-component system, chemotaxis family, sensor kinase Cph1